MDGIVYGPSCLGFATFENIVYVMDGGFNGHAFTAVPAHACFGAIMGYYIAMGHFGRMSSSEVTVQGSERLFFCMACTTRNFTIMNHQGFGVPSCGCVPSELCGDHGCTGAQNTRPR